MSNKNIQQEPDELQNVEQALSKTEQFIENNRKNLVIGLCVVAVVSAAIVWFFNGYVAPKNVEAADKMAGGGRADGYDRHCRIHPRPHCHQLRHLCGLQAWGHPRLRGGNRCHGAALFCDHLDHCKILSKIGVGAARAVALSGLL